MLNRVAILLCAVLGVVSINATLDRHRHPFPRQHVYSLEELLIAVKEQSTQPSGLTYCNDITKRINHEVQEPTEANYCSIAPDCEYENTAWHLPCRYGCIVLINQKDDKELCEAPPKEAMRCSFMCITDSGTVMTFLILNKQTRKYERR